MTHPTDEELEAMGTVLLSYAETCEASNRPTMAQRLEEAAAMLRACKSDTDHSDWNAAIEAAADACISAIGGVTHYGSEPYEICAAAIRQLKKGSPQ